MTAFLTDLRDMGTGLTSRASAVIATLLRTTLLAWLLRLTILLALLGACAFAFGPRALVDPAFVLVVALVALAAVLPRSRAVSLALWVIGLVWVVGESHPPLWRVLGMAATLYVAHASAAFAAVLPHDCAVTGSAVARWAVRTLLVIAASLALGGAGMAVLGPLPPVRSILGPIAGSLFAAAIAGLIAGLVRRREAA